MKKIVIFLLSFLLVFSMYVPNETHAQQAFKDVPTNHSNYNDIMYLVDRGVISIPAAGSNFGVNTIITREEVAVMVSKAAGLNGTPRATKFSDVKQSNPNSGYIQSAVEAGIINGYEDGTFKPATNVTRGHMATFIARAFDLPTGTKTFKDVKKGSTAFEAVSKLAAANITTGYEDGTFKPANNLTRAHISAFLARVMKFASGQAATKEMQVHFIDVGQGDAILIESPNGETMLVDGGTKSAGDDLVAYLTSEQIKDLDYVVATHPDADHIGGLIDVFAAYKVNNFVNSGKVHTSETYKELLESTVNEGSNYIEPATGDFINLDSDTKVQVLHSESDTSDNNDASIVLKITYSQVSFLLTGDADTKIESDLIAKYNVTATILKAGHHGSSTSSSLSFLQKVKPKATILSYGADNSYGHPHDEVINNLKAVGSKMYSTAQDGTIVVTTNGVTYKISAKEFTSGSTNIPAPKPEPVPTTPVKESYTNCTELRKVYPNGVNSTHPAYEVKHDGDRDGYACEPPKR